MGIIHCISGLGADGRAFQKLAIPDIEFRYVPWPYFDKHDELPCYAQKVASLIPQDPDNHILGLSLGGMLATEIAIMRPGQKVFIVSSAKSPDELPDLNGILRFIGKNKLIPTGLRGIAIGTLNEILGAQSEEEEAILKAMLMDADGHFIRCATKAILEWQRYTPALEHIVHIHGTADKVIPPEKVRPTHWIKDGEHMMIFSKADEVSQLIARHL